MKEIKRLAKAGWYKAMIHQGTLSLILTLDDFLISGPHLSTSLQEMSSTNPNIFYVNSSHLNTAEGKENHLETEFSVNTYFILRPYIRGILYGLNSLYQISLYVPCYDQNKITLYKKLISKIDFGGLFFQDRIYWNYEALRNDIMDTRLACLVYSANLNFESEWLKKISIVSKPFIATSDIDLTKSENLFDLIEMRSFFEDVHQQYFSLLNQRKKLYFCDMIRLYIAEKLSHDNNFIKNKSHFLSTQNVRQNNNYNNNNNINPLLNVGHSLKYVETKFKKGFSIFQSTYKSSLSWKSLSTNTLLEEYGEIINEQLKLSHEINHENIIKSSFGKILCRWNQITQRKSDILKMLMDQNEKEYIQERLKEYNSMYCLQKYQSENDLFTSVQSSKSTFSSTSNVSNDSIIPDLQGSNNSGISQFTKWYTKEIFL